MRTATATLLVALIAVLIPSLSAAPTCNSTTEFNCQIGATRCIPAHWICDNVPDCENGIDEMKCSKRKHECGVGMMVCMSGECVDAVFKCDGSIDCTDGSDEMYCPEDLSSHEADIELSHSHQTTFGFAPNGKLFNECKAPRYRCRGNGPCIAPGAICDGDKDCPYGDDEVNCTMSTQRILCASNTMSCHDGLSCVPYNWLCDGAKDCEDGSDEENCNIEESITNRILCHDQYKCGGENDLCIPYNRTCDGARDCPEGDDEGETCDECRDLGCEYKCRTSATGARCYCPAGTLLADDGTSCVDIDECLEEGRHCQHYCENSNNKFHCKCAAGYTLGRDLFSCRLDSHHEGRIFIALGNEIRRMPMYDPLNIDFTEEYAVQQQIGSHGTSRSIAYLASTGELFTTIAGTAREGDLAVSVNGRLKIIRENIIGIGKIAVDSYSGNIFFTQKYPSPTPGISICTPDGFYCKQIISGLPADRSDPTKKQSYMGLAVYPQRGLIFWIDSYGGRYKICVANMDGSEARTLIDNKLELPSGLTIDIIRGELYFADVQKEMIEKINVATLERHIVLSNGVIHPSELLVFNGFLYWSEWGTQALKVAELTYHHTSAKVMHSFHSLPYGIALNHSMYQQTASSHNPCKKIDCPWMCVGVMNKNNHLEARCVCPTGYISDNNQCTPNATLAHVFNANESYTGFAVMKELCEQGKACLNGGICEETTVHGISSNRITCSCQEPFDGEHCEHLSETAALLSDDDSTVWLSVVIFFVLLSLTVCLSLFLYHHREKIESLAKYGASHLSNVELPSFQVSPIVENIRNHIPNINSIRTPRAPQPTNCVRVEFDNPLFNDNVVPANGESTTANRNPSDETPRSNTQSTSFSNPHYSEAPVTAGPFSGYEVTYSNKFVY